jgi:hypothetical protein
MAEKTIIPGMRSGCAPVKSRNAVKRDCANLTS